VLENFTTGFASCGTDVITRTDSNYHDVVVSIANDIDKLANSKAAEIKGARAAAMATAAKAQWTDFIKYYDRAYGIAFKNRNAQPVK